MLENLPGLHEHGCSYKEPGGFVRRLREDEGTWLGHVMEHVAIELQVVAGSDVTFGRTRSIDGRPGFYNMVFQYKDADVGREASKLALNFWAACCPRNSSSKARRADWDFAEERDRFIRYAQRREFGPSTASLVRAAEERDIPWLRLNRYSLVQFGHGRYQQRIQATTTGRTSNIAVELASDKEETNGILRDLGLPVPKQMIVRTRATRFVLQSASVTRSYSSRWRATTAAASPSTCARPRKSRSVSRKPRTRPHDCRRELHRRLRPSPAGRERRTRCRRQARARARARRR